MGIQDNMLDNEVLISQIRCRVDDELKLLRKAIESNGLRISRSKKNYMECKSSVFDSREIEFG